MTAVILVELEQREWGALPIITQTHYYNNLLLELEFEFTGCCEF